MKKGRSVLQCLQEKKQLMEILMKQYEKEQQVLRQMEEQMAQDESKAYFTDQFTAIDPEQNFYWNADGDLVLVFDEYSIAAGYMGMPEFVIPASVYEGLLK